MQRRELLRAAGAAMFGMSALPFGWTAGAEKKRQKLLYFTRSAGFPHPVVVRKGEALAFSEKVLTEMGQRAGFDVECSQDPKVFDGDLSQYDTIAFYTSGNPISNDAKQKLLDAIAGGKGFVGFHAATDSFRRPGTEIDPYIAMIGAEFVSHGPQQKADVKVTSPSFPGIRELKAGDRLSYMEEWYALKKFAKDLHVILVQETEGMKGACYQRPPFPATWARKHGKGRVFYTSFGHREDIWTNPVIQAIMLGGIAWTMGNVEADVAPNIEQVTPGANQLQR